MTKEEYISMKQAGQFSLPCFYQYYADHVPQVQDKTLRSFETFSEAFPIWWNQKVLSRNGIIQRVQEHFDQKFGIVKVDTSGANAGPGAFGGVGSQQSNNPQDPFGFYNNAQNAHGL